MQLDEDLLHDVLDVAAGADEARNEPADRLAVRSDEAIERAIRRSSPLPLPENRSQFQRTLELKFRPLADD